MLLRTRITFLLLLVMAALVALLGLFSIAWNNDQKEQLNAILLKTQQVAWERLQKAELQQMESAAQRILANPKWARAWAVGDRGELAQILALEVPAAHRRIDVLDEQRRIVATTSSLAQPEPIASATALDGARVGQGLASGLEVSSDRVVRAVVLQGFRVGDRDGVLTLGADMANALPQLGALFGASVFLLNSNGRELAATVPGQWAREQLTPSILESGVQVERSPTGLLWRLQVQALNGLNGRAVVRLVVAQDVSAQGEAQSRDGSIYVGILIAVLSLLAAGVFVYLRFALRPLERSVQVLRDLAHGQLRQAPEDDDVALVDEAGAIARGVAALRAEMLNFEMLRDERIRAGQQQERLIRRQLKELAEAIDESARHEILEALEQRSGASDAGSGGSLVELAQLLGRMSGLVISQQDRLVGLLTALRNAMVQQAKLLALEQELAIARKMQMSILPRLALDSKAVQLSALMIPAKEVGGDFYDYFLIDENLLALVMADVSGKGIPAAFFMAISRTLLKSNICFFRDPALAMSAVNELLCAENEEMMFVTVFVGILDLRTGHLSFVSGGHNPPVVRRRDGQTHWLTQEQNVALAVLEGAQFEPGALTLGPGDTLFMYTDGVTEAADTSDALYGEEHLLDVVEAATSDAVELPQAVLASVREFENSAPQADDITCMAVRWVGVDESPGMPA